MSEYVHGGSSDARGSGSTHKANNDADQRKQVSTKSCCVFLLSSLRFMVFCRFCSNGSFPNEPELAGGLSASAFCRKELQGTIGIDSGYG